MFILGKNWLKYRKKKYYFHNYIFCKFEIVVCFAPLLHRVEKNTFLNFDSITDSLKSKTWNSWKRIHCNEEARRIRGNGTSRSRMQEWRGKKNGNVPRLRSLPDSYRQAGWECETLRRFQICDHWVEHITEKRKQIFNRVTNQVIIRNNHCGPVCLDWKPRYLQTRLHAVSVWSE